MSPQELEREQRVVIAHPRRAFNRLYWIGQSCQNTESRRHFRVVDIVKRVVKRQETCL